MRSLTAALVTLGAAAVGSAQPAGRVVDLGHPLAPDAPTWSGAPAYERTVLATFEEDGAAMGRFCVDEHFGTHVDAPAHFSAEGWTVDAIPPERLIRPGVTVHVEDRARADEDYRLDVETLRRWEDEHGRIPEGVVVLVATGWDARWGEPERYRNERDGTMHFPGIAPEAARFLATERRVAGIGIDTPSVDYGPSADFATHRTTMPRNVYHIENAARLTELPATGFTVVVAPTAVRGGSGAPARVFALLP